jgi:hypothetical protein
MSIGFLFNTTQYKSTSGTNFEPTGDFDWRVLSKDKFILSKDKQWRLSLTDRDPLKILAVTLRTRLKKTSSILAKLFNATSPRFYAAPTFRGRAFCPHTASQAGRQTVMWANRTVIACSGR